MYKFQKELVRKNLPAFGMIGLIEGIKFDNGLAMSIQCSDCHYCEPRENLEPSQYTHYEIGILYDDEYINRDISDEIGKIFNLHGENLWLFGYVPAKTVQMVYNYLKNRPTIIKRKSIIKDLTDDYSSESESSSSSTSSSDN